MFEIAQVIFAQELSDYERGRAFGDGISKMILFGAVVVGIIIWFNRKKKTKE